MSRVTKLSILITVFLVITGSIFYIYESNRNNVKLFQDTKNIRSASYQQRIDATNSITNSRRNIITETVANVSPAVVGISVTEIRHYVDPYGSFFNDPFFRQFFGDRGDYSQKIKGLGSGFIISPDGYIVTNDHVAGNASEITVTLTNGEHYKAKIVGDDQVTDIALLKIDDTDLPYVNLGNSDSVIIGEWAIALGNPFGLFEINDKPTVTVGVISATGMNLEPLDNRYYLNMIQTDAAINGGNSGGPLVNSLGNVIGMNTLIFTGGNGSQGSIGLGFAIPINKIKKIVKELKENGKVNRDFSVGLSIQSIDKGIASYYKLNTTKGVIVTQVYPNSPASKAGIKVGDIIVKVNDYVINDQQTMVGVFQEFRTGQTVKVDLLRDNKELTKEMTLEKSND